MRSPRLHPKIEGAGVTCRRSPRLHPQTQAVEDDVGATRRRGPGLHPQIEASEEGVGATRRIRRRRGTSPASLPDDDDMLREILLRLPPQPSSLPRASAVCKRWRGLLTDPKFHRQFYAHHRKPPLLGVFSSSKNRGQGIVFSPILDPPDRIPPQRFDLGLDSFYYDVLDCRHGRVLVMNIRQAEVFVCDPITDEQRCLAVPPEFKAGGFSFSGALLCAARDQGHVHGGCHSSPFKVVLMSVHRDDQPLVSVYTSETGTWRNVILTQVPCTISGKCAVLVRNCLYWYSQWSYDILEFDLGEHSLTVIRGPPITNDIPFMNNQIIQAEHGALGYVALSYPLFQMWQRNVNGHGVATWVPWKTIEMHSILKLPPQTEEEARPVLLAYDEEADIIFLSRIGHIYMVQLKSMQSKKFSETIDTFLYHPFRSFYTPAIREGGEADMLHDP